MSPEEIAELRARRYNATVVYHQEHPHRPDGDAGEAGLPPAATRAWAVLHAWGWATGSLASRDARLESLKPEEFRKIVRRAYSISCSVEAEPGKLYDPTTTDWLEFYIVLVRDNPDGRVPALTPRLFSLKEGDRIQLGEKMAGHYTLAPVAPGDSVIFLSTGTGEAPHNYMLWELLRRTHPGKILSACCVRYTRDLGYVETHRRLMGEYPNYKYLALTTREPGLTKKVYIQDLITSGELEEQLGTKLDPASTHVFLCGNPKMIGVPAARQGDRSNDVSAASRGHRGAGEPRVPRRRVGDQVQGEHSLRGILVRNA